MSEKSLWSWLNEKMGDAWESERIEGCSVKGFPDSVVRMGGITTFIELKDWSGKDKHPLSTEQGNFLETFGGVVVVRIPGRDVCVCHPPCFQYLMTGDLNSIIGEGRIIRRDEFFPERFILSVLLDQD